MRTANKPPRKHETSPTNWRWKAGGWRYRVPKGQEPYWDGKKEFTLGPDKQIAFINWANRVRAMYASILAIEKPDSPVAYLEIQNRNTKGVYATIDADLFDFLNQWKWRLSSGGYVYRYENGKRISLHRVVAETPDDMFTDHINRDPLDNRRCNLRHVTHLENAANRGTTKPDGYKGVHKQSLAATYSVTVKAKGKSEYIGSFDSEEIAALVYDACALIKFGEYAALNFPLEHGHAE